MTQPGLLERTAAERGQAMDANHFAPPPVAPGRRLNLGAGRQPLDGWENWDRKTGQEIYPLAVPDDSLDAIRASHVLEHFSHRDVPAVLADWVRALKPGGTLAVAVPDFAWVAHQYLSGEDVNAQGYVMGGHVDADDRHGCLFDREELEHRLRKAGLYDVRPWASEAKDCAALPVSLNLQGRKKGPLPALKIKGAMSVPRLGFQDNFYCWAVALAPLGIYPTKYDGAYWGQCLERVLTEQVRTDADYLLTVDYDSAFTRDDVEHLLRLAAEHPEADAIAPLELYRGRDLPLASLRDANGRPRAEVSRDELQPDLVAVATAHFGLTLLRRAALECVPHPWFLGVPNAEGRWEDGRVDADTYFWHRWKDAGHTVYLAPHVVVAHGQFMLAWPGRGNLKPVYQHPADFWETGKPDDAWR